MADARLVHIGTFRTIPEIIGRFTKNPEPALFRDLEPYTGAVPTLEKGYQPLAFKTVKLKGPGTILKFQGKDWNSVETCTYYSIFYVTEQDKDEHIYLRHIVLTDGDLLVYPLYGIPPYVAQQTEKFQEFLDSVTE